MGYNDRVGEGSSSRRRDQYSRSQHQSRRDRDIRYSSSLKKKRRVSGQGTNNEPLFRPVVNIHGGNNVVNIFPEAQQQRVIKTHGDRTEQGKEIHGLIIRVINNKYANTHTLYENFKSALKQAQENDLTCLSSNNFSHLHDIVHFYGELTEKEQYSPREIKERQSIYFKMFKDMKDELSITLNEDTLRDHVNHVTKDGFTLLQQAAKSGYPEIWKAVIDLVKEVNKGNQEPLKKHVNHATKDGFTLLDIAAKSGNHEILKAVIDLVKGVNKDNQEALKDHVNGVTEDGFTLLHTAAKSADPEIWKDVIKLVKEVNEDNQEALEDKVNHVTKDGFTLLQQAVYSGNPEIWKDVIKLVKEVNKGNKEALKKHVNRATKDGFTLLHTVAKNGDPEILKDVIKLVKEVNKDNQEALEDKVNHVTKDGFTLLHIAAKSGNPEIWNTAIKLVKEVNKEGNQEALKDHVNHVTKDGFTLLQQAANSGNPEIWKDVIDLVKEVNKDDPKTLRKQLLFSTNKGFNILHQSANSLEMTKQVINDFKEELEKENPAINHHDILSLMKQKALDNILPSARYYHPEEQPINDALYNFHVECVQRVERHKRDENRERDTRNPQKLAQEKAYETFKPNLNDNNSETLLPPPPRANPLKPQKLAQAEAYATFKLNLNDNNPERLPPPPPHLQYLDPVKNQTTSQSFRPSSRAS